MRVLIVEDDRPLGLFLHKGLKLEGHDTSWVEDGEAALEQVGELRPDLVVLDLSLPRRDGMEVLEALRSLSPDTCVLVLTGRNNLQERIRCLNLGADDCLLKPFSFHELAARCRAVLRRKSGCVEAVLRHGSLEMDLVRRIVLVEARAAELTAKEFALLEFLMRRKGACCSREDLLQEVWKVRSDTTTNVVDVYVNYLRKKLGAAESPSWRQGSLIETVRGAGIVSCRRPFQLPVWQSNILGPCWLAEFKDAVLERSRDEMDAVRLDRELHDMVQPLASLQCRLEVGQLTGGEDALREAVVGGLQDLR